MTTSTNKYFKNSNTGQLICETQITSDVIKNVSKGYYDIYNRFLGTDFNLKGFLPIKKKKWNLYRTRWQISLINDDYFLNLDLKKNKLDIRKEKIIKINKL